MRILLGVVTIIMAAVWVHSTWAQSLSLSSSDRSTAYTIYQTLDSVCSSTNPLRGCGTYQSDIDNAAARAETLNRRIRSMSNRDAVYDRIMKRISDVFYFAQTTRQKVAAAYYYVYFSQYVDTDLNEDYVDFLFDNRVDWGVNQYRPDTWSTSLWWISNQNTTSLTLASQNSNTTVDNRDTEIEWEESYRAIEVSINDRDVSRGIDLVVATIQWRTFSGRSVNQTVAATESRNGIWKLELWSSFAGVDEITFATLCSGCTSTYSRTIRGFNWYRVMSARTYDVSYDDRWTRYNDRFRDNRNYRFDDTFEMTRVDGEWYYRNRDTVEFELTIDLENETNDDIRFNIQDVNIDSWGSLRSSDYDRYVEEVDCDGQSRTTRQTNLRIDEDDECEVRIRVEVDEDELDDRDVEIEVEFYDQNNRETIRTEIEFDVR